MKCLTISLMLSLIAFSANTFSKDINLACKGKVEKTVNPVGERGSSVRQSIYDFNETISIINNNFTKTINLKPYRFSCSITQDAIVCPNLGPEELQTNIKESSNLQKKFEEAMSSGDYRIPDFPDFFNNNFLLIVDRNSGAIQINQSYAEMLSNGKKIVYLEHKEGLCELAKQKF